MKRLALLFLLLSPCAARAAEVGETVRKAFDDYLNGDLEAAVKDYRYLTLLGVTAPNPDINLALLARDQGDNEAALPLWIKTSLQEGADGFVWNQRGWAYLSMDRTKEARECFGKAIERSTSTAMQAEANLGLGMTALQDGHPKAAMSPLRDALVQGPYVIAAAAHQTALTALGVHEKQAALAYLRQSLNVDPMHLESLKALARLYENIGENRSAWRADHMILSFDPGDKEAQQSMEKLGRFLQGSPDILPPVRRLSRTLLAADGKNTLGVPLTTATIRVALFSGFDGKPATAQRVYFVCNAPFRIVAANGDVVKEDGKAFDQWEVEFHPENNIVEVRDTVRNIQYTSKQPFRIEPVAQHGSVLLKSADFAVSYGIDLSDRELRGIVEIVPTPYGFNMINDLNIEEYLYGATAAGLPQGSPSQAYKAQAVIARTKVLWHKMYGLPDILRSDICDSIFCQKYLGLNEETIDSTKAVAETEGWILMKDGRPAKTVQHQNCGGFTENGAGDFAHLVSVHDGPAAPPPYRTPAEFERWLHDYPPRDLYCEAGSLIPASDSRWVRTIPEPELRARVDRIKDVGPILGLRAARRSPTGRIQALEIIGAHGKFTVEGDKAISDVLSPNSLRSTLFTIQSIMRGRRTSQFVLWGAGTGSGLGMCSAGAIGQASLGRDWHEILTLYFPKLKIDQAWGKPAPPPARKVKKEKTRHKNPRHKKKK